MGRINKDLIVLSISETKDLRIVIGLSQYLVFQLVVKNTEAQITPRINLAQLRITFPCLLKGVGYLLPFFTNRSK